MWFISVEVEKETSAPPPKKNPGSAPLNRASDILRKKSKISWDFQGKIRGKISQFRGIFAGKKSKLAEKSADFTGNFGGKLRQETISKKQPISLDSFAQEMSEC